MPNPRDSLRDATDKGTTCYTCGWCKTNAYDCGTGRCVHPAMPPREREVYEYECCDEWKHLNGNA
jgi:hypothetical protein